MKKESKIKISRNSCIRCGTCCIKGGPVLHHEDKRILLEGYVSHQHLLTIRKGEPAINPVTGRLEPAPQELIKVRGKDEGWSCLFYNEKKAACTIYKNRFIECRLLKCWDTSDLISIMGKDTITRSDIINPDDPIVDVIKTQERECSYNEIENLISNISGGINKSLSLEKLREIIQKDISIRSFSIKELGLKKDLELFIFGRPLFKVLSDLGLSLGLSVRIPDAFASRSLQGDH
ncbi:MAG: YkgJ family cysteine cluster protein [Nitrospirota bacterium]